MKLHEITVENLNSLYGRHSVDFDGALAGSSLFLIEGPTGSGKSTLMDAVSLALFATTPRMKDVRSDREIAEQIMSRGTGECSAQLVFSKLEPGSGVRRRYRARWIARRARERADGRVQATVRSLERLDGDEWTLLVSDHRSKEVDPAFTRVLEGFTPEDFRRSMLLAQGQFDAMLHARPEERASILERLTSTERYREIGARAARLHSAWKGRIQRLEAEVQAIGSVDPGELEAAEKRVEEARAALAAARARVNGLEAVQRWRQDLARKREELKEARERQLRATAALEELSEERAALGAFDEARPALERLDALDRIREAREKEAATLAEQREVLPARTEAFQVAEAALQEAEDGYRQAKTLRDRLREPLSRVTEAASALRQATTALETAKAQATTAAEEEETGVAGLGRAREETREARVALASLLDGTDAVPETLQGRLRERWAPTRVLDSPGSVDEEDSGAVGPADFTAAREAADQERSRCRRTGRQVARVLELRRTADRLRTDLEEARAGEKDQEEKVTKLREELDRVALAVEAAEKAEAVARADFEALQLRHSLFQYRSALEPGDPCPLCGSQEHPWAHETPPEPGEAFDSAKTGLDEATAALQSARSRRDRIRGELDQRTEAIAVAADRVASLAEGASRASDDLEQACREAALDPALDVDELESRAALSEAAVEWLDRCDTALGRLESHTARLTERHAALTAIRRRREGAESEVGQRREEVERRQAVLDEARRALSTVWDAGPRPDESRDRPGLDAGESALDAYQRTRVDSLETARDEARRQLEQARGRKEACEAEIRRLEKAEDESRAQAEEADAALRTALAELGIDSEEAVRARRLPDGRVREIRERVEAATGAVKEAEGACQARTDALTRHEAEKPEDPEVEAPDAALAEALEAARATDRAAQETFNGQSAELLKLNQDREKARAAGERLDRARQEGEVWHRLHRLIGVRDGQQFKEFAQALNLRRLLLHANRQLSKLRDRYRLRQIWSGSDDEDDTPRFPTLDFEIEDQLRPGAPRSIKTLSGGESFLVSLALALGLSDLRTGSMPVETLLLDEGFGTLDPETLDTALAALQQLQASGRQIGIISHVVGLKERIEARIEVRAVGNGRSEVRVAGEGRGRW
ncbi:MAG: AAA family ATPase [Gemmatimonadota bacterium]